jgi:DNA gyrase subunit A
MTRIEDIVLHETTREKYLNYALSVITARALPDVRDGLKPVQRRILYAMHQNLRLLPDSKPKKSAAVVGEVMAKYHPHGDQSIYDAMVRMAQSFSLRYPLVDGQGNFGSTDGDRAAAMRYTEAKLRHIAGELLSEINQGTTDFRPNYDGSLEEPVVLPAQVPNLLINGASGIAVGMATSIPPHNLREVGKALLALIENPDLSTHQLVGKYVKGPDFPTGGEILIERAELREIYTSGSGSIRMRGEYHIEGKGSKRRIVITSVPYNVNKANLIGDIAEHIRTDKVPQLLDVRDESTDEVRIVLELKRRADPEMAMAYLFKRTSLESRFNVNLTALCPKGQGATCEPRRLELKAMLQYFLTFRLEVTTRRLAHDLARLRKRIHILEAFAAVLDDLDRALQLIRSSDGKSDARERLMEAFELDYEQAEAILETKLYRLAKLEVDAVREELDEKNALADELAQKLRSKKRLWILVREELEQVIAAYGDRRRTKISGTGNIREFSEEDYIVTEDSFVIVTRQGRIKRQKSYTDITAIRVPEGDEVGWIYPASTTESLILFSDRGRAYTLRVADVPSTTGYGDIVQTRFDFTDGEKIIGAAVTDARSLPTHQERSLSEEAVVDELPPHADDTPLPLSDDEPPIEVEESTGSPNPPYGVAVSRSGKCLRFSLDAFRPASTVKGRIFMRLDPRIATDGVAGVIMSDGTEILSLATRQGRFLLFDVNQVKILSGAGRGVTAIRLERADHVMGFVLTTDRMLGIEVETNRGRIEVLRPNKYQVTRRGNRGREIIKKGYLVRVFQNPVEVFLEPEPEPEEVEVEGEELLLEADESESGEQEAVPEEVGQGDLFGEIEDIED